MQKVYIKDLKVGDILINHKLAIKEIEKKVSKNNKEYYNILLADKSGQVEGKIWADYFNNCDLDNAKIGSVVVITGKVDSFNSNLQMIVEKLNSCSDYDPQDFLSSSPEDTEELFKYIFNIINEFEDAEIKALALKIFSNEDIVKKFKQVPAGEMVHHNYVGGLVKHVSEMLKIAEKCKEIYSEVNFSELAFGVIFHDIGKVYELSLNGVVLERTISGYLVGHLGQGLMLLNSMFDSNFSEDKKNRLLHMIISHHGEREKGSPVQPMTLEAILLSEIDNVSYKVGTYYSHLAISDINEKGLTGYNKYLGTSIMPHN